MSLTKPVIVNGHQFEIGKVNPMMTRQPSKWDGLKEFLKEPNDCAEGFKSIAEASACAGRLRKVWGIPTRAYTNLETKKFGVMRVGENESDDDVPEDVEATITEIHLNKEEPVIEDEPVKPVSDELGFAAAPWSD